MGCCVCVSPHAANGPALMPKVILPGVWDDACLAFDLWVMAPCTSTQHPSNHILCSSAQPSGDVALESSHYQPPKSTSVIVK